MASAIIVAFFSGHIQLAAMIVILSCFMFVHLWVNPYCKGLQKVGLLEASSLLLSIFLFGCAIVFLENSESIASIVTGLCTCACVLVCACVFVYVLWFSCRILNFFGSEYVLGNTPLGTLIV